MKMKMRNTILVLMALVVVFVLSSCSKSVEKARPVPSWVKDAAIYEVNIRQYTPEGTFNAFSEHLPRLQEMGVKILWIMPIQPIGDTNRKGLLGSYYSIKDYYAINPEFGTFDDFRSLVNEAHKLGMYVIIDWVANHSAFDCSLAKEHPEWYKHAPDGSFISPYDWTDVIAFDYSNPQLRKYMTEAMKWWLKETSIDGFRCDVAGLIPVDFWENTRKALDSIKPVFMLAEADTSALMFNAFNAGYNWRLLDKMVQLRQGKINAYQLLSFIEDYPNDYPQGSFKMNFTSNHDINSWTGTEQELFGDAALTMAVITATVPGMPLIYSGQEEPAAKRLKFFDKDTIHFAQYSNHDFYRSLFELKKRNSALWHGEDHDRIIPVQSSDSTHAMVFLRQHKNNKVLIVLNLSDRPLTLSIPDKKAEGKYNEIFLNVMVNISPSEPLELEPWGFRVFEKL